jgi:hypothetical protein
MILRIVTAPALGTTLPKGLGVRPGLEDVRVSPVLFSRTDATSNVGARTEVDGACDEKSAALPISKHNIDDIQAIRLTSHLLRQ